MTYVPDYIDLKDWWKSGGLKEVNERYFWPKGLALTVCEDEDGVVELSGIQRLPELKPIEVDERALDQFHKEIHWRSLERG